MATSKTLAPTNVTISIPAMTDAPNASVLANCADKEADAINALNSQLYAHTGYYTVIVVMGNYVSGYGCTGFVPFMRSDSLTSVTLNSVTVYGTSGDKKADFSVGSKYMMGFVLNCSADYSGKSVTINFTAA